MLQFRLSQYLQVIKGLNILLQSVQGFSSEVWGPGRTDRKKVDDVFNFIFLVLNLFDRGLGKTGCVGALGGPTFFRGGGGSNS